MPAASQPYILFSIRSLKHAWLALKNKIPRTSPGHSLIGAEEEIRTPMPVTALPPQSSASTSFATSASRILKWSAKIAFRYKKSRFPFKTGSNFLQDDSKGRPLTHIRLFYKQFSLMISLHDSFGEGK